MTFPLASAEHYLGDAGDFLLVNRFARRTPWLHGFMSLYAGYGVVVFVLLLVVGWWLARSARDLRAMAAVVWTGLGTLIAVGVNQPIASAVAEKRPYVSMPHVLVLVARSTDYSFPSDHAVMAGAVAAGLCFVNRRLGITAWVLAALIAFARVYVGAHYPHDVAVGLALGAAVVIATGALAKPLLARLLDRLAATPLRPVLTAPVPRTVAPAGASGS